MILLPFASWSVYVIYFSTVFSHFLMCPFPAIHALWVSTVLFLWILWLSLWWVNALSLDPTAHAPVPTLCPWAGYCTQLCVFSSSSVKWDDNEISLLRYSENKKTVYVAPWALGWLCYNLSFLHVAISKQSITLFQNSIYSSHLEERFLLAII